jgi:hypothetical protein
MQFFDQNRGVDDDAVGDDADRLRVEDPALFPPPYRTTIPALCARTSTILPLASSPH